MIHILIVVGLAAVLLLLVRRGLIHVDLSFPWFVAIIVLGVLSTSEGFIHSAAAALGIVYPPIAIVFLTIFIVLGLITSLLIIITRLRCRQIQIVRRIIGEELKRQDETLGA
jgi:hypothetical protein